MLHRSVGSGRHSIRLVTEEIGTLSINTVEPSLAAAPHQERRAAAGASQLPTLLAGLAPLAAAGAALAVHHYLPGQQMPPMSWMDRLPAWQHPYPILMLLILGASSAALAVQSVWRPFRPLVRHY